MKVGLIDVDGHNFPNLALMRISAYHKKRGDFVEWWQGDFWHYDIAYSDFLRRDYGKYKKRLIREAKRLMRKGWK